MRQPSDVIADALMDRSDDLHSVVLAKIDAFAQVVQQNMTPSVKLRCGVAGEQREPKGVHVVKGKKRPSKEFAQAAFALLDQTTKSRKDLAKEIRKKDSTIDRFAAGKATLQVGHDIRAALAKWGQDVSTLPLLDDVGPDAAADDLEEWEEEWLDVGRKIHGHSEALFRKKLSELEKVLEAFSIVSEEMAEIGKVTPSNRPIGRDRSSGQRR